ncbi:MAG: hypothetical protein U0183_23255 [Polyangiaceae bacterium]
MHRELEPRGLERKELERLVAGLVRAGWIVSEEDRMEKDGETIVFVASRSSTAARTT